LAVTGALDAAAMGTETFTRLDEAIVDFTGFDGLHRTGED
jgi:hypothetical protein